MQCPHCAEAHPAGFYFCPQTGRAIFVWETLVGRTYMDRYRLHRLLDTRGRGALFEAEHLQGGLHVAIKIVHPEYARGDSSIEDFLREAAAVGAIEHPNLPHFVVTGRDEGGAPFVVRKYEKGESLASRIGGRGPLPLPMALALGEQLLGAIIAAHGVGVAHRAITPLRVILLDVEPAVCPVLLDFGAAHLTAAAEGAPYRAPEQRDGAAGGPSSDLYSLALTLNEAMTGRAPSADRGARRREQALKSPLDSRVATVLERAMCEDPGDRFASAQAFLDAWRSASDSSTVPVTARPGNAEGGLQAKEPATGIAAVSTAVTGAASAVASPPVSLPQAAGPAMPSTPSAAAALPPGKPAQIAKKSDGQGAVSAARSLSNAPTVQASRSTPLPSPGNGAAGPIGGDTVRTSTPPAEALASQPPDLDIAALEARAATLSRLLTLPRGEATPAAGSPIFPPSRPAPPGGVAADASSGPTTPPARPASMDSEEVASRSFLPWAFGGVVLLVALVAIAILSRDDDNTPRPSSLFERVHVTVRAVPASAVIELDGERLAGNPHRSTQPVSSDVHRVRVTAPGHAPDEQQVRFDRDLVLEVSLRPLAATRSVAVKNVAPTPAAPPATATTAEPTSNAVEQSATSTRSTRQAAQTTARADAELRPSRTAAPQVQRSRQPRRAERRAHRPVRRRAAKTRTRTSERRPAMPGGFIRDNPF